MTINSTSYNEPIFKAAVVEWLSAKGYLQHDAVLINELPISNFNRRVDLVVANGKLHAFEIKSDLDTTHRLIGQIETYLEYFDKVSLVCSHKFVTYAKLNLPADVEIIQLDFHSGQAKTTIKQRGRTNFISKADKYLSFMTKKDLVSLIKSQNLACNIGESRTDLYQKISKLPKSIWREAVLKSLKVKYSPGSSYLKRKELMKPKETEGIENKPMNSSDFCLRGFTNAKEHKVIDISESMARNGFVTNHAVEVIPRQIRRF